MGYCKAIRIQCERWLDCMATAEFDVYDSQDRHRGRLCHKHAMQKMAEIDREELAMKVYHIMISKSDEKSC